MGEHRLDKYLTPGERVVVATHRHWAAIAEPIATAAVTLLLIALAFAGGAPPGLVQALLVAWLIVFGRAAISVWEWNDEWFIATDQRLLLIYGFIIRKVDMLPLSKVTDMTFRRSVPGRILGYGTFILESAGQDQALSDVHFIPSPNETYLDIVATIFKTGDDDAPPEDHPERDDHDPDDPDDHDWLGRGSEGRSRREDRRGGRRSRREARDEREEDDPTARPVLRGRVVRLNHHDDRGWDDPDTESFDLPRVHRRAGEGAPTGERHVDRHRRRRDPDYAESLYRAGRRDDDRRGRGR